MGGSNSGRYRVRNRGTVDAALRLDTRILRKRGFLTPGAVTSGVMRWHWAATGEETGSVHVTVNLSHPCEGTAIIRFKLNDEPRVQDVDLVSRPMRYGGYRYYFRCPKLGTLCEVLPMRGGVFASRQAHRLTYRSQSADKLERLREKATKLEKRLWPANPRRRPRGRNREQLTDGWIDAHGAFENHFAAEALRRFGRLL